MKSRITRKHIAICGMDCRLCSAYERKKNGCGGCREVPGSRFASCDTCRIRNCEKALAGNFQFCFSCDSYPCDKIKHIDKRYRTRYSMSMIENLASHQERGHAQVPGSRGSQVDLPPVRGDLERAQAVLPALPV